MHQEYVRIWKEQTAEYLKVHYSDVRLDVFREKNAKPVNRLPAEMGTSLMRV